MTSAVKRQATLLLWVLVATNRMLALVTASQIASASAASCDRLHAWLRRIVGASIAPSSVALTWRSRPQHQQRKSRRAWFDRCVSIRVLAGVLNDRCPAIDLSQELGLESFRRGFVRRYRLGIDGFKALGQVRVPE